MSSMCSASHPSSRAMTLAMRRAQHFLARMALPPYPDPYDHTSRESGNCTMYLVSLHGHTTSSRDRPRPSTSGYPTECTVRIHGSPPPVGGGTPSPPPGLNPPADPPHRAAVPCHPRPANSPPTPPLL